jgi:hypothetical protein
VSPAAGEHHGGGGVLERKEGDDAAEHAVGRRLIRSGSIVDVGISAARLAKKIRVPHSRFTRILPR